jgi:2-phospho-L-lactate guanylyltransferase
VTFAGPALALIPMKRFADAKSRLAGQLTPSQRSACAREMFLRVLAAAQGCGQIAETWVLTNGDDVAAEASALGAQVLRDAQVLARRPARDAPALGNLIDAAIDVLTLRPARAVLVLMGDLPELQSDDLSPLVAALTDHDMALISDARGPCTNALAARLPIRFPTAFGHPQSYGQHLSRARGSGLSVCELRNPHVALDIDTFADLPRELAVRYVTPG